MLERIRSHQFKVIKALDWERGDKDFVPLRGIWHSNVEQDFELDKEVGNFLSSQKKVLLLLGHSGGGKSFYTKQLALSCWSNCVEGSSTPIPVWISLPSVKDPINRAIQETFQTMGFVTDEVETFRQTQSFLFILDGYDEIHNLKNLYIGNELSNWRAKVVITCRQEYLYSIENYASFFMPFKNERPLRAAYSEIIIRPFNSVQIEHYGKQFIRNHDIKKDWESYAKAMSEIPGLQQLIMKPFMLKLAMEALPSLVKQYQDVSIVRRQQLTQARLYDVFVDQWFIRQEEKLKSGQQIEPNEDIKTEFWGYAKSLAKAMYEAGKSEVFYVEEESTLFRSETKEVNPWKKYFNPQEPRLKLLRTACLVQEVSLHHYAFMHNSLIEYFLTRELFESALIPDKKDIVEDAQKPVKIVAQITEPSSTSNLNQHFLVKDVNIIQFLADRVWEEPAYKDFLFDQVYASKNNPQMSTAASNAITILNHARVSLSGLDLSGVHIPKANLENAILDNTQLVCANLEKVDFRNSWLKNANLESANLKDINLAIYPAFQHKEKLNMILYSQDGHWLATCAGKNIYLWDTKLFMLRHTLQGHTNIVNSIVFSSDQEILASGSDDNTVRLWAVKSGQIICTLLHSNKVSKVVFGLEDKILVSASDTVKVWDLNKSQEKIELKEKHIAWQLRDKIDDIAFSFNEEILAVSTSNSMPGTYLYLYYFSSQQLHTWQDDYSWKYRGGDYLNDGDIKNLIFNPMALMLAFENRDCRTLFLWDMNKNEPRSLKTYQGNVMDMVFHPNGKFFVYSVGSGYGHVCLYDVINNEESFLLENKDNVIKLVIHPDGHLIALMTASNIVQILDFYTKKVQMTLPGSISATKNIIFSPDGKSISIIRADNAIQHYDISTEQNKALLCEQFNKIKNIFVKEEKLVLIKDGFIELRNLANGQQIFNLNISNFKADGECYSSRDVFSPDENFLACIYNKKKIQLWNVINAKLQTTLEETSDITFSFNPSKNFSPQLTGMLNSSNNWEIKNISFSSDGKMLASVLTSKVIHIWNLVSEKIQYKVKCDSDKIRCVILNQDGKNLAYITQNYFSSDDFTSDNISLWDLNNNAPKEIFLKHAASRYDNYWGNNSAYRVLFSPDGKLLLCVWQQKCMVEIWNVDDGYLRAALEAEGQYSLGGSVSVFSPNGQFLALDHKDSEIKIWDIGATKLQTTISGHKNRVMEGFFSTNSEIFIWYGVDDARVCLYHIFCQQLLILRGHKSNITSIAFSKDNNILASGGADNTIRFWDMQGKCLMILDSYLSAVKEIAWKNNDHLITLENNGSIKCWHIVMQDHAFSCCLIWSTHVSFYARGCTIKNAIGLSSINAEVLRQEEINGDHVIVEDIKVDSHAHILSESFIKEKEKIVVAQEKDTVLENVIDESSGLSIAKNATQKDNSELVKQRLPKVLPQPIVFYPASAPLDKPPLNPSIQKNVMQENERTKLLSTQIPGNFDADLQRESNEEDSCCQCAIF